MVAGMKSKLSQRRYRASKSSACGLCKPQQRGRADKKTIADLRHAISHDQEIRDWKQDSGLKPEDLRQ
jgi:hypothetical protein